MEIGSNAAMAKVALLVTSCFDQLLSFCFCVGLTLGKTENNIVTKNRCNLLKGWGISSGWNPQSGIWCRPYKFIHNFFSECRNLFDELLIGLWCNRKLMALQFRKKDTIREFSTPFIYNFCDNFETTLRQICDNFDTTLTQLKHNFDIALTHVWDNFVTQVYYKIDKTLTQLWYNCGTIWEKSEIILVELWENFSNDKLLTRTSWIVRKKWWK